jgi:osmotically-inducible protein OsmY
MMPHDRALQEAVLAELVWEPSINAAHIGVTADTGIVTLSGHVENFLQKRNAEKATARVRGVRAVVEELLVKLALPLKYGDEEIARAALNRLDWEDSVPAGTVKVRVEQGWVTLSGLVEWHFQREAAEKVLRGMTGIVGIQNDTIVKSHPVASDIRAEIDAALHRSRFDPSTITVTAEGGVVTLSGTVPTMSDRYVACQTAWNSKATSAVHNDLAVA